MANDLLSRPRIYMSDSSGIVGSSTWDFASLCLQMLLPDALGGGGLVQWVLQRTRFLNIGFKALFKGSTS